jgi:hypothetical protein
MTCTLYAGSSVRTTSIRRWRSCRAHGEQQKLDYTDGDEDQEDGDDEEAEAEEEEVEEEEGDLKSKYR